MSKDPDKKRKSDDNIGNKNKSRRKNYTPKKYKRKSGGGGSGDDFLDIILGKYFDENYETESDDDMSDYEEVEIKKEINTLDDLIDLGKMYKRNERKKYNINLKVLNKLIEPITELKNMIGMKTLKNAILNQIIYSLQDFEEKNQHMMHTIIEGPPGSGKTEVANILAKIYAKLGILKSDYVLKVKRSDLIGQYLGQTAIKTQKAIDDATGGVLLIDEAYSLGNPEGRDSYSKECIDTLNQNLSEGKSEFICIIVGYKDSLKSSFFSYNKGLERRFPFRYTIDEYTADDLKEIFCKLINDVKWNKNIDDKIFDNFFNENRKYFTFNGGDLETLIQCCKIAHARRVFCLSKDEKKILTEKDLERGLEILLENEEIKKRDGKIDKGPPPHMYC